jgi:hypothetical protein
VLRVKEKNAPGESVDFLRVLWVLWAFSSKWGMIFYAVHTRAHFSKQVFKTG